MSDSCDHMDYSPPGSSVHRISQARILEWIAVSFSRGSSQTRDQTCMCYIAGEPLGSPSKIYMERQNIEGDKQSQRADNPRLQDLLYIYRNQDSEALGERMDKYITATVQSLEKDSHSP